ncbi:MAG: hypothetical protein Q9209_006340 [Squamulea sp. 1 TL-2023]
MSNGTIVLHASLRAKASQDVTKGWLIQNSSALKNICEVQCSWSSVDELPKRHYDLISVNVNINVLSTTDFDRNVDEQSIGLTELLTTIQNATPLIPGTSWSGRVLVVVPTHSGYLARTKCFEQRFTACTDLGVLHDRTIVGQRIDPVHTQELQALFDHSVLLLVRSGDDTHLSNDATAIEEVHARINFQWLLDHKPKRKTLALIDAHLNLESYLPLYNAAMALGVDVIVLDRPGHWISDPSMRHLYSDFIPIDMTVDDAFHIRIASAVRAYGNVDGLCAIASACLTPVAKAAQMLGLPAELPEAVACASNKYQARLIAGGAAPTTLAANVSDLQNQMAEERFVPQYPLIVKPYMGAGSVHVRKADNEAELLKGVRLTGEESGKKVLIEAYIEGPELDVNFILLNREIVFFEISDDFPSPGDRGIMDGDFWENTNVLPSKLPADEYAVVRHELHGLLLRIGFKTGVFHLEARVQDSSMAYSEEAGLLDLRPRSNTTRNTTPRCVLIEINPRPPGFNSVSVTACTYGVNMYDLHVLASLGEHGWLRALARPFEPAAAMINHARAWSQLVSLRADKGGICASDDVCAEMLQRLSPDDQRHRDQYLWTNDTNQILLAGSIVKPLMSSSIFSSVGLALRARLEQELYWENETEKDLPEGRLNQAALNLLEGADIQFSREHRLDIALVKNLPIALVFLPAADIPTFVGEGRVDLGITGYDQVQEHQVGVRALFRKRQFADAFISAEEQKKSRGCGIIMDLGFGACKLQVQVPERGPYQSPKDLIGKNIGTSFVHLAERYFRDLELGGVNHVNGADVSPHRKTKTNIVELSGSVEAAYALGVADGIVDLVESGETMKAAGLKPIDTVLESNAILIKSHSPGNPDLVDLIAARIRGAITAQRYVLCQYNIERRSLAAATKIAPGKRAPTVISLDEEGWIAVSVMVEKKEIAPIMDELIVVGATDILVLGITNTHS